MASTSFYKGQQLGRNDLNLFISNVNDTPVNAAEISYALYDFTTGSEVLVGPPAREPANPAVGEYYASLVIPLDANLGEYRVRWTFREYVGAPINSVLMGFSLVDRVVPNEMAPVLSSGELDMARRLRILLRDNNPDRNYHFRPPTNEETISQFSRVFGFIWEDGELQEYLERSLDEIIAAPPRTPFANVDNMVAMRPEWRTLLLTGAMYWALFALRINWIADEFDYTIGGVSLNLEKSSKYEGAQTAAQESFTQQLEKAKATVNILKGVQQPKFGTGIRSAFGPYSGRGVLSPRKFVGF
jgi:hypothetical protein